MNNIIPSTIVDGFFDDPYRVREFGLQSAQSTQTDNNGLVPIEEKDRSVFL